MAKAKAAFDQRAKDLPQLEIGDRVRVQDWRTNSKWPKWIYTGTILYRTKNGRSYRVQVDDHRPKWLNRRFLRPLKANDNNQDSSEEVPNQSSEATTEAATTEAPRRSDRSRKPVVKFDQHRT